MTTASELPTPDPAFALEALTGAWYLLFTSDGFWRQRTHPRVEYGAPTPGPDGREQLRNELRFRKAGMIGGVQRRLLVCVDEHEGAGLLRRRAQGMRPLLGRRWSVPAMDPRGRWVVVYHVRAGLGGGAGVDVCTRDPSIAQGVLDEIVARIQAEPLAAARQSELFATTQDWIPPRPYRLG